MGVGGQRHAPAALPPRMTRYPLYRRLGRPQGRSGRVLKILSPPVFDPRTVQPVASRYTDWAIAAHLLETMLMKIRNSSLFTGKLFGNEGPLWKSFHLCSITRKSEKKLIIFFIIFITGLQNKPQGCGASVASAAVPFTKKKPSSGWYSWIATGRIGVQISSQNWLLWLRISVSFSADYRDINLN
jgi:hypothetical protein